MPASSGVFSLLDLIMRDPNAGGARGMPVASSAPVGGGGGQAPATSGASAGIPSQADARVGGGMPGLDLRGYEGKPVSDAKNWYLTRSDLQSPLAYMAAGGNSPFVPGQWRPNDQGGYFTLDQLYGGIGNVPSTFAQGSSLPSTNNWQLTVPYGGGPGDILRNGQLIRTGQNAALGQMLGSTGSGITGSAEDVGSSWNIPVNPGAALSGQNVWASQYWPGGSIFGHPFGRKGGT